MSNTRDKKEFLSIRVWRLLLLAALVGTSMAACGTGCLMCADSPTGGAKECKICDIYSSFLMGSDGTCRQQKVERCEVASLDRFASRCLLCEPQYVLDSVLDKCVSVQFASVVSDCMRYDIYSECVHCNELHFLVGRKCVKTTKAVKNCAQYKGEEECAFCVNDYYLDEGVCKAFPQTKGCAQYSHTHCDQCKSGFSQDLNFYMRTKIDNVFIQNSALAGVSPSQVVDSSAENCFRQEVKHCKVYRSPTQCKVCESGYFVSPLLSCEKFPINRIKQCVKYSSATTCTACQPLFYLNGNECHRRTEHAHCEKYKITTDDCDRCTEDHYLSSANVCSIRDNSSNQYLGCKTRTADQDNCSECQSDYDLLTDGVCFKKVENCVTHVTDHTDGNKRKCSLCHDFYFLISNSPSFTCTVYKFIPQCQERVAYQNHCHECAPGYYVNGTKQCSPHSARFCASFKTQLDECEACIKGFEKYPTTNQCLPSSVDNCQDISSTFGECSVCLPGFYKTSGNQCEMYNLVGCLTPDANKNECVTCDVSNGYYLNTNSKQCHLHSIAHCKIYNPTNVGCQTCEDGYTFDPLSVTCIRNQSFDAECVVILNGSCAACRNSYTHYLEPIFKRCQPRQNTNFCSGYVTNADLCTGCSANNFYLSNGRCFQTKIPHCTTTVNNKNQCEECDDDYFLDGNTKTCLLNQLSGCQTESDNSGFGCKVCNTSFVLNARTKICEESYIANCATYVANEHRCQTCESQFFLAKDGNCYYYGKLGCSEQTSNSDDDCTKCLPGFYMNAKNYCEVVHVQHCKVYVVTSTQTQNSCQTCHDGFYESSGNCLQQSLPDCLTYLANKNECSLCVNLKKPDGGNLCVDMTSHTECVESNGLDDTCITCKPGFKKSGNNCTALDSSKLRRPVPDCLGNDTTDDAMCQKCQPGFARAYFYYLSIPNPPGCKYSDSSKPHNCGTCLLGFEKNSVTPGICSPIPKSYTGQCIQASSSQSESMQATEDSKNNCELCRNYMTHYLSSGECKLRTALFLNCTGYISNSGYCQYSYDGFFEINPKKYPACGKNPGVNEISNCAVYDMVQINSGTVTSCFQCAPGFYGAQCDSQTSYTPLLFGEDYQFDFSLLAAYPNADAADVFMGYARDGTRALNLASAKGDKIPLGIPNATGLKYQMGTFSVPLQQYVFNAGHSFTSGVIDKTDADLYGNSDNSHFPVFVNDQCAMLYNYKEGDTFYGCVVCKPGLIGMGDFHTKSRGDAATNDQSDSTIKSCVTASDHHLSRHYLGIGYKGTDMWGDTIPGTETNAGNFADLFLYDTCDNGGVPVGFVQDTLTDTGRYAPVSPTIDSIAYPVMACIKNINPEMLINDCQVYAVKTPSNKVVDPTAIVTANIACIGCKPGFRYTTSGSPWPFTGKECEPIPGCDLESEDNTWMNACAKCKKGFAWRFIPKTVNILYHECVQVTDENCKIYNTEDKNCFICDEGYVVDSAGVCVEESKYSTNCTKGGYPMPNWNEPGSGYDNTKPYTKSMRTEVWSYMIRTFGIRYATSSCTECSKDFLLVKTTTSSEIMEDLVNYTHPTVNCTKYDFRYNKCKVCKTGYVLLRDNSCVTNESMGYSKQCTEQHVLLTCSTCEKGYTVNLLNKNECLKNDHFLKVNTGSFCEKGYYSNLKGVCVPIPVDDICSAYSYTTAPIYLSKCLACKDPNTIPLHIYNTSSSMIELKCIPITNYKYYPTLEFSIIRVGKNREFEEYGTTDNTRAMLVGEEGHYTQIDLYYSLNISSFVCLPEYRQELNCKEYHRTKYKCDTCANGFYMDELENCVKGNIPHCDEYADAYHCGKCVQGYFATGTETSSSDPKFMKGCKKYAVDCQQYSPDKDSCIRCKSGAYMDTTTATDKYDCKPYTVPNCAVYSPSSDECRICEPGAYLDSSGKCKPINVVNCIIYSKSSGSCLACKNGFYLENGTSLCKAHSILNCEVFGMHSDSCDMCSDNYYLDDQTKRCLQLTLDGCASARRNKNECLFCKNGYYLDKSIEKCRLNTALYCLFKSNISNNCVTCVSTAYLDKTTPADLKCKPYRIAKNCTHFDAFEDKCKGCQPGFYHASSNGTCMEYSIPNCLAYKYNTNECTACQNTFYLESNVCLPVTAYSCLTFSLNENACSSCPTYHYKDITKGDCVPYSQEYCATYDPFNDNCVTCQWTSYLTITRDCRPYSAENCLNYVYNDDVCSTCVRGYYMDQTVQKCKPYTVANCDNFNLKQDACTSCIPNHYLKLGKCNAYSRDFCSTKDPMNDRCLTCLNNFYFEAGECKPYTAENCLKFDSHKDLCTKCRIGYYFEFGLCFEYTVSYCDGFESDRDLCDECDFKLSFPVYKDQFTLLCQKSSMLDNCSKYSETQDKCDECSVNYYLDTSNEDGPVCVHNPTGVANCERYLSEYVCNRCEPEHFLRNNLCYQPHKKIVGCAYYSSDKYCMQCSSGFALNATSSCESVVESSCLTYRDIHSCASCLDSQVLQLNKDDYFVCESSNIPNCAMAKNSSEGVMCQRCEIGYFIEENRCHWPDTLVENCQEYLGHGFCGRCEDDHILSKENTLCTNNISDAGSQCMVGHFSLKPQCSVCKGGYYFGVSGACQKCSEAMAGCALCEIGNLTQCKLCMVGFHMTDELVCRENPTVQPPVSSAPILRSALLALLFFVLGW